MKQNRFFSVVYMFIVTAFFSSIVIGFSQFTKDRVDANKTRVFELAVLSVLPDMYDPNLSGLELHRRFVEQVKEPDDLSAGAYILKKEGKLLAYALPIQGQGFWAPIKAVIGISSDRKTVTGVNFYQQSETPGLGAEIAKDDFQNQFKGRALADGSKPINFKRAGEKLETCDVHAVTGATQTCVRLEKIINDALNEWRNKLAKKNN